MSAPIPQPFVEVPAVVAAASAEKKPKASGRDRYLDLLRSLALVRVVVYHLFGFAWLSIVFPSMGVMFALAGSLMARSLSRPAWSVIRGRLRRLLPPMWAFGAVILTAMFAAGWKPDKSQGLWWWAKLFNYLVPVGTPPFPWSIGHKGGMLEQTWAVQAAEPLWYLRAYLWFVLASPLLLKLFRKVPWAVLLAPLALTAVLGTGVVTIPGDTGSVITDFVTYAACWVLGFAHHDGLIQKLPRYLLVSCASMVMAFGLWWASGHPTQDGWDLNDIPLAQATWSFGFCAILLAYSPSWPQLPGRLARYDRLVTLSNNRAVTIYLWHNTLIAAAVPLLDQLWNIPGVGTHFDGFLTTTYDEWMFVLVWPLIGLMILSTGWIEDVAAKRSPRLWPDGRKSGRRKR
ncbi:acyltransferase [Streptomyces melanogenes]|uniref:acyltransferase n=1 Tax=Streptomyces melanogenes TaxID=67326 RepID=UPI0037976B8B